MSSIYPGIILKTINGEEYNVLGMIGEGGFANVFKLQRVSDDEIFALKTLRSSFSDKTLYDSFRHEIESALKITSKNVIKYYDYNDGQEQNNYPPYIIMEYAEIGSLKDIIDRQKEKGDFFSNEELISMYRQLINGMIAINKFIVHRDLTPRNVLIVDDILKITDFGLAKFVEQDTRGSTFKGSGSFAYMSPEAWTMEKNTVLMDMYSLGLIFYELATLDLAYEVMNCEYDDWKNAHLYQHPKMPNLKNTNLEPFLTQLIQKMIEKRPNNRFQTWEDVIEFIDRQELNQLNSDEDVNEILLTKIDRDLQRNTEKLMIEKKEREKEEKRKMVNYAFQNDILFSVESFVQELNIVMPNDEKCRIDKNNHGFSIVFSKNQDTINFEYKILFEEDFYRDFNKEWLGKIVKVHELKMPLLEGKMVLAWGIIRISSGKGYNIILIEEEGSIYGQWILLENINTNWNSNPRKPEPFAFNYSELEVEINNINCNHIYRIKAERFNSSLIKGLFKDCV